ncbi:MAG: hypothetical protein PHO92_05205 [Candidatus Peribacteraceae bacterium]|nr:hypothetical protein [Candidatus Peribacteraceae bacterium]
MSNTHKLLRFARSSCFVAGMLLLIVAAKQQTWAQEIAAVTGQGALIFEHADLHAAPATLWSGFTSQMLIGVLLLLAGFALHALIVVRRDRPVRVHAARRERQRSAPAEQLNVYWMHVRVR